MAYIPRRRRNPIGLNLTPMIDVTFQILIFFVCANTWSYAESAEKLDLPAPIESAHARTLTERPRVTINLRPNGQLIVAGQDTSPERLAELLRVESRRHGERLEVILRAHKEVPFGRTQEVFQACSAAGVKSVRFAVSKVKE